VHLFSVAVSRVHKIDFEGEAGDDAADDRITGGAGSDRFYGERNEMTDMVKSEAWVRPAHGHGHDDSGSEHGSGHA